MYMYDIFLPHRLFRRARKQRYIYVFCEVDLPVSTIPIVACIACRISNHLLFVTSPFVIMYIPCIVPVYY